MPGLVVTKRGYFRFLNDAATQKAGEDEGELRIAVVVCLSDFALLFYRLFDQGS